MDAHPLLAQQVNQQRRGSVVLVGGQCCLAILVLGNAVNVGIEQVGRVKWTTLRLGMELSREDWSGLVNHALVAGVVEIDKVLFPVRSQRGSIDRVAVILRCDVALASREV